MKSVSPRVSAGYRSPLSSMTPYPGIGAIVSFCGPPELTGAEMRQLPGKLPLCLVYGGGSAQLDLKQLFGKDIVQAVVVGRLTPPDPKAARPKSTEDWFNRYYQLMTPATVDSPPIERPL